MNDQTPTRPVQQQGLDLVAPPKLTECPRCGGVTLTREGVKKHDADHLAADKLAARQAKLLARLEQLLDSIETNVDQASGRRLTLSEWIEQTDDAIDDLVEKLGEEGPIMQALRERPAANGLQLELEAWPGDPGTPEPIDEELPASLAADVRLADREPRTIPGRAADDDGSPLVDAMLADEDEPDEDLLAAHDDDVDDFSSDAWGARR